MAKSSAAEKLEILQHSADTGKTYRMRVVPCHEKAHLGRVLTLRFRVVSCRRIRHAFSRIYISVVYVLVAKRYP